MTAAASHPVASCRPDIERVALEATRVCHNGRQAVAPERVLIVPWGDVQSASGDFVVDGDGAAQAIAAFSDHGADLPVDYEHQTLGGNYASPNGQAPAAGWITRMDVVTPDALNATRVSANSAVGESNSADATHAGIWANISWTDDAKRHLEARRYRYLSPVALVRKRDRKLIGIHSVALTNKPAIVGMTPVVNRASSAESDALDLTPLKAVLRLDDSIPAEAIVAGAVSRVRELERRECERAAQQRVEEACRAGKLTTPQRDWAFALALKDSDEFDRWLASAPVVVPLGRTNAPPASAAGQGAGTRAAASAAQAEWQANRAFLERLCTEAAYVASAMRDAT